MINKLELCTKALSLRKRFGEDGSSPIDIFSLAHTISKLTTIFYPMGDNISGICIKNSGFPIIAINSSMSVGRQRFSMAHELFHLYYDDSLETTICAKKIGGGNEIEKSADQFASYFIMPPSSLNDEIIELKSKSNNTLSIKQIVKLEQHFQISRQAMLFRLVDEKHLTSKDADKYRKDVINSALKLGFDDALYRPLAEDKQYATYGYYIQQVEALKENDLISTGKYEELLFSAFRSDLVYGGDFEGGELNDWFAFLRFWLYFCFFVGW